VPVDYSDLDSMTAPELARLARAALRALAARGADGGAFRDLLAVVQLSGECLGIAARDLAGQQSWSHVGSVAGTTRQAAWARWHE
jgi:hypothetical protein